MGRGSRCFPTGREVGACSQGLAWLSPASCRQLLVRERSAVCLSSCRGAGVESELPPTPGGLSRGDWCRPGSPRTPASAFQGRFWLPGEDDGGRGLVWGYGLLAGGCEAAAGLRLEASIVGGWVGCRWPVGPRGFLCPGLFLSRVARWGGAVAGGDVVTRSPLFLRDSEGRLWGFMSVLRGTGLPRQGCCLFCLHFIRGQFNRHQEVHRLLSPQHFSDNIPYISVTLPRKGGRTSPC